VRKSGGMLVAGGASLVAMALLLAPTLADAQRGRARTPAALSARPIDAFTPAVSDPRLAAALARRSSSATSSLRFTPAAPDRNRNLRVAVRADSSNGAEGRTALAATSATPITAITPSSYNLGVSVGWRRFAISGDMAESEGGLLPGRRESAQVGVSYRANRRITGRVAVAAERAEGAQQIVALDEAYSLDVGGSYSIARNLDLTAGARYRIARDRLEPLAREERRDSQAVYIGTAFRF